MNKEQSDKEKQTEIHNNMARGKTNDWPEPKIEKKKLTFWQWINENLNLLRTIKED